MLDPKGEILRDLGGMFEAQGVAVTVIDLVHFKGHYNPLVYHNCTATDEGYRCDHCGNLVMDKQLAGYPNVKGTYTPATGSKPSTVTGVPQTGDESNMVLWLGLLIVSGLALGGLAIAKRKKQQK